MATPLRVLAEQQHIGDVKTFGTPDQFSTSDQKELHFWSTDPREKPGSDVFQNILRKSKFMAVFTSLIHSLNLKGGERVLELGAGHGWASAILKQHHPSCYVISSDVSPDAVSYVTHYEELLRIRVDEKWAFPAQSLPFADNQFDLIFCFAAFHHSSSAIAIARY